MTMYHESELPKTPAFPAMAFPNCVKKLFKLLRRPSFWFIFLLLVLITIPQYAETLHQPRFLINIITDIGVSRHTFERIFYLAPIIWSGFLFHWKGVVVTSLAALICMLPRALFISPTPRDASLETGAVFIIGNVLAISFRALRRERDERVQLLKTQRALMASEERYRSLFENAHDAIWMQDMDGNILAANPATARMTCYDLDKLLRMNVRTFLSEEGLEHARAVRARLLQGEASVGAYDQRLVRPDGTEIFVRLSSSLIMRDGKPVAFQHIARDITQEKRMQENLHFYLRLVTRAQEEERQRISRELHDDTVQSLVVLSRKLDSLSSSLGDITEDKRQQIEELWEKTNEIMLGVRRLSRDLRPAALGSLGLMATLERLASDVSEYSGIATRVTVRGTPRRLPEEMELVLFRIVQEALRNVWRHSQASKANVDVEFQEGRLRITICDDGRGFKLPETIGDLTRSGKLGLVGMEERAILVGGKLNVRSQPGNGTVVTIELPA